MSKLNRRIEALERRQRFLEQKLKTSSLIYGGRSYDDAENEALKHAISIMKEKQDEYKRV